MKDIKLCGLGNGLLDLQYEVDDEYLVRFGLNKGEMRLVSSEVQAEMINSVENLKFNKSSGGSAANTIIAFAQFGGKSAYQTTLGNDDFGWHYANEFKELGIELSTEFLPEVSTGTCLVLITPDSERTMNTHLGASALFNTEHVNEDLIKRSEWIYLEGYKLTSESSADAVFKAIEIARINNTKIAFTFSDVFV
ncbi:MAG: adenosine kinase, partial [Ignavibacteria bacterium]|nr:adenosine kinase [Ignavibacteria bacterium]